MLIKEINELKTNLEKHKKANKKIGLVPTMGYLHEGHLSLIKRAKKENDIIVVSIFVNPTQFAPNEDFDSYPRDIDRDYKLAMEAGADIIFNPEADEIYIEGASTYVNVEGEVTKKLCGASRPTHFKGVTTIVNILFNIVLPNSAYFGQKDAQQAIIIKRMVRDLHMDINIVICPIVREKDGLAMSSRNIYLSVEERKQALVLNRSLQLALDKYNKGEKKINILKNLITNEIQKMELAKIDYIEIFDLENLNEIEEIQKGALGAVAVNFGKTRLIDNVIFE